MQDYHQVAAFVAVLLAAGPAQAAERPAAASVVKLVRNQAAQRVDVLMDGQPFTSYRWTQEVKKPVLFPIRTEGGALITRGWPLEPRPDEATDHRHHVGFWLNYGDVNGVDFWGHSDSGKGDKKTSKGTVLHRHIRHARSLRGRGELGVTADWVMPDGSTVLREQTDYIFSGARGRRVIERTTTLTAVNGPVDLPDNKEGTLGLRLARGLEHPGEKNPRGTGRYRSSEGIEGEAVWGTRGRWMMLTGRLDQHDQDVQDGRHGPVTIAILDHHTNPGHPTYWHARPWGLFAANPLGQKALSKGKETLGFKLAKGQAATFRYKLLILSKHASPEEVEAEYSTFAPGKAPTR